MDEMTVFVSLVRATEDARGEEAKVCEYSYGTAKYGTASGLAYLCLKIAFG